MTNDPDLKHVFDVTKGYCEKHGHTPFACVKCAAETQTDAPSSDLSTIAELHKLRAENERLRDQLTMIDGYATNAAINLPEYAWAFDGILEIVRGEVQP